MAKLSSPLATVLSHPGRFTLDVLRGFRENQGLLLAGAVAYYTLLSIIPMFALLLIVLSYFLDPELLLNTASTYLSLMTAARTGVLTEQLGIFLEHWQVIGILGIALLLFFSSLAFTVLENAMSMIFFHRQLERKRHFLVSAIIPYLYILFLALGFLAVSVMAGWLNQHSQDTISFMGAQINMTAPVAVTLYLIGIVGEVLLLTSIYLVMPVGRLAWSHALIGGVVTTIL